MNIRKYFQCSLRDFLWFCSLVGVLCCWYKSQETLRVLFDRCDADFQTAKADFLREKKLAAAERATYKSTREKMDKMFEQMEMNIAKTKTPQYQQMRERADKVTEINAALMY